MKRDHRFNFFFWLFLLSPSLFSLGCGVRGDPEPPEAPPLLRSGQEAEKNQKFIRTPRTLPLAVPAPVTEPQEDSERSIDSIDKQVNPAPRGRKPSRKGSRP